MANILYITTDTAGQINVLPRRVKIIVSDNLATVTAAGYLNPAELQGYTIFNTDIIDMWYGAVGTVGGTITSAGTLGEFTPSISNGVVTLVQNVSPGNVLLPVVSGDFAIFNGTSGQIKDSSQAASSASNPFVVTSPGSLTTNHIAQIADANGSIKDGGVLGTAAAKAASNNALSTLASTAGSGFTIGHVISAADTLGTIQDSGIVAANLVQSQSNVANNFVSFTKVMTLGFAALATAGKINIVVHPSGTSQFYISNIQVLTSTGLSGGGGNRLLAVTDGTLVWNNAGITAALLGTPIFTLWGGTGNPIPVSTSQVSTAGADIYFQYTGGTTDYTAGSVIVAVTLVQVTA